ncbi:hypothetical protein [Methylogaea oryzae]|nr:hypothetical protein [Methylogaea oryzae]
MTATGFPLLGTLILLPLLGALITAMQADPVKAKSAHWAFPWRNYC